jgi:transposase InsO family protein
LAKCSPKELELAFAAQHRFDARRAQNLRYNATDYRDKEKQKQAKEEGAPRLAAFVRRVGDRGGAGPALATELRKEACESINRALEQGIIPKQSKLYGFYQIDKKRRGEPVSRESFRKILNQDLGVEKLALLAGGKRAFHASRPRTGGKQFNPRLAIAGLRMHIDGVYGDVRAKPDEDALYARPIFYPLIDDITGKIHGRGIKVGRPSRLPVAMAHRDCYMRNGYLPAQIYHDWGPEFDNILVPEMVGYFGVGYERRPAGAPRFGGYGEMFNAQFSAFLQSLAGGTYFDKAGRAADGSKKSRKTAELEIPGIIHLADEYMFETWNNTPIGNNNKTPNELDEQSKACFPEAFVYVADDFLARYYTSIPLSSEEFDLRSGYRYGDQRYTSAELIELLVNGKKATAPRLDCMNPSVVYALTDNGPIALHSSDFHRVSGMEISQRISTLRELVTYSTTAMANQMKRNQREAKQLAEMSKVAARAADADPKEMDAPGHRQQDVYKKVDFSDVDTTVELQRLIYEDVK